MHAKCDIPKTKKHQSVSTYFPLHRFQSASVCLAHRAQWLQNKLIHLVAKLWKQPRHPATDEWMKKRVAYIHHGVLLSPKQEWNRVKCRKMHELETIMLSEISCTQKVKGLCFLSYAEAREEKEKKGGGTYQNRRQTSGVWGTGTVGRVLATSHCASKNMWPGPHHCDSYSAPIKNTGKKGKFTYAKIKIINEKENGLVYNSYSATQ